MCMCYANRFYVIHIMYNECSLYELGYLTVLLPINQWCIQEHLFTNFQFTVIVLKEHFAPFLIATGVFALFHLIKIFTYYTKVYILINVNH